MLERLSEIKKRSEQGDTLVEVTIALSILSFVLLSAMVISATAFRMGQTARERTQLSAEAQEQMEALRSFRDNHSWEEFRGGSSAFLGVDSALAKPCKFDGSRQCFHMEPKQTASDRTEWVPAPGYKEGSVPTSALEITFKTPLSQRACGYDFELYYTFDTIGSNVTAKNRITTRLVNLKYDPGVGLGVCPS